MKISEAINRLIALQGLYGDLEIRGYGHNSQCLFPLQVIDVKKFNDCNEWFVELDCDPRY